jgi:hypothetical protein
MFFVLKYLRSIGFCEKDAYIRHVRSESIMQSADADRRLRSWLTILQEIFDYPPDAYSNYLKKKYYRILFQQMSTINLHSREAEYYPLYRQLVRSLLKKSPLRQPFTLALSLLLLPQSVYRTWPVQKAFGLCIK